jgi:thiamine biosynthesis lipoprotein ApbE
VLICPCPFRRVSEAALDLGGIAKGWALDEIVDQLRKAGFNDAYVDWWAIGNGTVVLSTD